MIVVAVVAAKLRNAATILRIAPDETRRRRTASVPAAEMAAGAGQRTGVGLGCDRGAAETECGLCRPLCTSSESEGIFMSAFPEK